MAAEMAEFGVARSWGMKGGSVGTASDGYSHLETTLAAFVAPSVWGP